MKKYVTIKMEEEDLDELKKYLKDEIELAEFTRQRANWIEWLKKMLENIKKEKEN